MSLQISIKGALEQLQKQIIKIDDAQLIDIGALCKQGLKVREFVLVYFSNMSKENNAAG